MTEQKILDNLKKAELHKKRRLKKGVKVIIIVTSILAAVYFGGVLFFNSHYLFNTVIDGDDFSLKTAEEAEDFLRDKTRQYVLQVVGREEEEDYISAEDIDIKNIFDGSLEKIIAEQNQYGWIASTWKKNHYHIDNLAEFDNDKLENKIKELKVFDNSREPEDAYIGEFSPDIMQYPMIEEDRGTVLIYEKVKETVENALSILETKIDLDEYECYKEPAVTKENPRLKKILNQLNGYTSAKIIYDWHGIEEIIDGNQIKDWLVVEEDRVDIDEEAVRERINQLSREHDTFGRKRTFITAAGEEITIEGGAYGWRVNRSEETEELLKLIRQRAVINREPVYLYTGYNRGGDDIGNSYVEIDLTNQHLYLFIDGELILESDFVSGNISRGYGTPTGIYGITYKERNATLKGENYATPVSYWMPFNGNIGMHDAGWRNKFGGKIYKTNGSHGCINLPKQNAEIIYGYLEKNFPVICYKGKEDKADDNKQETEQENNTNIEQETGQNDGQITEPEAGQNSNPAGAPETGESIEQPVEVQPEQGDVQGTVPEIGQPIEPETEQIPESPENL